MHHQILYSKVVNNCCDIYVHESFMLPSLKRVVAFSRELFFGSRRGRIARVVGLPTFFLCDMVTREPVQKTSKV